MSLFALDTDFIKRSKQPNPDDWGTSQPHNAYDETPLPARLILHAENRLDSGDITKNILIHESWKYSPKQKALKDSYKMVAPDTLAKHFSPTYARLNEFEKECKDHWKQRLVRTILCTCTGAPLTALFHVF